MTRCRAALESLDSDHSAAAAWTCMHEGRGLVAIGIRRLGLGVSIGIQSGPRIGIQKGPPFPTFRTISARPVGAGRGCGDGASAGCSVIVSSALEAPAVIAGFDDVAVVGQAI